MTSSTSRIAVALGATLVLGACQDTNNPLAPTAVPTASISAPLTSTASTANASVMAAIGGDLVDGTEMFLVVIKDAQVRADISTAIKTLADALTAGDVRAATSALEAARTRLAAVPGDATATELAPVGLALDQAELVLSGML